MADVQDGCQLMDFKDIITEATDPCNKMFGDVLFGELGFSKDKEQDTEAEKEILNKVLSFIRGEFVSKKKDAALIKAFEALAKCRNKYPRILKPETRTLYRGVALDKSELKNIKITKIKNLRTIGNFVYKAKSKIQSWTATERIATDFAFDVNIYDRIPVIMEYKFSEKEILFNTDFLNFIATTVFLDTEDEIIRISDKPINVKINFDTADYKDYKQYFK